MKRFLIILSAAMLLLSSGVCMAKKPVSPEKRAKQFVERIFSGLNSQDMGALESTTEDVEKYISSIDETQQKEFGEAFAKYVYEYSDMYDYGKEFADMFLMGFSQAMAETGQE